jgi:lipopolysaccharide export system permease protein
VRIIDKYLLKEFALPLMYCFDAFLMLWIVLDLLDSLSDFIQYHAPLKEVLRYYLIVLPEAIVLILPMSLLLGVLFCLSNLGKHNELIAMRASGMSVMRLAMPLLAIGALATVVVFGINEAFVPRAKERAEAFMSVLRERGDKHVLKNFFYLNATARRDWYVQQFNTHSGELEHVEVRQQKPDGSPEIEIFADRASWAGGEWTFYDAQIYTYKQSQPTVVSVAETNFPAIRESPKRLALEGRKPDQLTTSEIRRYIRTMRRSGRKTHLAEYEVTLHYRYAFPLTCLLVVWIAIPFGMRVSRRGPLLGVGVALLLVVAFYFMSSITIALGKGERVPPMFAAWLTNVVFGLVGAVLLARAR